MAIQQAALMAYKAPVASSDSAYLIVGDFDGSTSVTGASITFNPTVQGVGYVSYTNSGNVINYIWKTGPNDASNYRVKYIETYAEGVYIITGDIDIWVGLGLENTPAWTLEAAAGPSTSAGYLVIENSTNPGVELANVFITIITNTAG